MVQLCDKLETLRLFIERKYRRPVGVVQIVLDGFERLRGIPYIAAEIPLKRWYSCRVQPIIAEPFLDPVRRKGTGRDAGLADADSAGRSKTIEDIGDIGRRTDVCAAHRGV